MSYQSYEYCGVTYYQSNEYCGVCHKDETIVLDNCPICLENISQINRTTTPCGHTFHGSCIFDYIIAAYCCPTRMSLICPLCRTIAFNNAEDGCQRGCCRPDLEGFRTSEEEDEADEAYYDERDRAYEESLSHINTHENVPRNVPKNNSISDYDSDYDSISDYVSISDYDSISDYVSDYDPNSNYDSESDYDPNSNYESENYQP